MFFITGEKACTLEELKTAKNSFFWTCIDHSDNEPKKSQFAIRFKSEEDSKEFEKIWNESKESNNKLMN